MTPKRYLSALASLAMACGGGAGPVGKDSTIRGSDAPQATAASRFADLETRLLAATSVRFKASVTATGAVSMTLEGAATIDGDEVRLAFVGSAQGNSITIDLEANADAIAGGSGERRFEQARPPALEQGLLLGLTRMGILHNLAVMAGGSPPEKTDGTAASWVTVSKVRDDGDAIAFDIAVAGEPSGTARLWLDPATGLPTRREQTVTFGSGSMSGVEVYDGFAAE